MPKQLLGRSHTLALNKIGTGGVVPVSRLNRV